MAPITRCCCTVMSAFSRSGSVSSTFWSTACSAQLAPGQRERPLEELGEVGGVAELLAEAQEEPVHLPADRLAQDLVLAAREQPVDGGARHAGRGGDVVDGGLGHPAPRDALVRALEHPPARFVHRSAGSSDQRPSSASRPTVSPGRSRTASHREQHAGHERRAVVGVVADGERLAGGAEQHLLVGDQPAQAHRVDVDARPRPTPPRAPSTHRLGGGVGRPVGRRRGHALGRVHARCPTARRPSRRGGAR